MVTKLQGNLLNSSAMNVYFISKILVFNLIPKPGGGGGGGGGGDLSCT